MNVAVRWAFSLFLFLLPWQTRWIFEVGRLNGGIWEYGTLSIYATEILLWIIVIASVAKQSRISPPEERGAKRGWLVACIFLGYIFFSAFWSPVPRVALFAAGHLLSAFVLFYLLTTNYKLPTTNYQLAFVAGAAFQAILGLVQFATQQIGASTLLGISFHLPSALGASVIETVDGRLLRAYGGLPHPNILGGYLAIALLLVIDLLFKAQEKKMRILLHFTSLILAAGLFVTFSRSAWLGFLIGLFFLLYRSRLEVRPRGLTSRSDLEGVMHRRIVFVSVLVAFAIFAFIGKDVLAPRLLGETRLEEISRTERVSGIRESLAVIRSSPWLGVGIGNYTARLANLAPGRSSWSYQPVHNVPLLILAELGLLGLLLLFFVIRQWSHVKCQLSIVAALGVILLFDHYPWSLYPGLLLVVITIGLSLRSHEVGTEVGMERIG